MFENDFKDIRKEFETFSKRVQKRYENNSKCIRRELEMNFKRFEKCSYLWQHKRKMDPRNGPCNVNTVVVSQGYR